MKHRQFIEQLDEVRIVAAVTAVEQKSSGEIRVFVSHRKTAAAVVAAAERQFEKLGMTKTRQRNGVLLYFAPSAQQFAIVGDTAIHAKCGDAFWQQTSAVMAALLKEGHFTAAIETGIKQVGEVLALHFPCTPDDQDELPNAVVTD